MKQNDKQEASLQSIWRSGFNENKEFKIYQYLCRNLKGKKEKNNIEDNKKFKTYQEWRNYVDDFLEKLDIDALIEFSHFLRHRKREDEIDDKIMRLFLMPLFVAIFASGSVSIISNKINLNMDPLSLRIPQEINFIMYLLFIAIEILVLVVIGGFIFISVAAITWLIYEALIKQMVESYFKSYFWTDYLEIVEDAIQSRKE